MILGLRLAEYALITYFTKYLFFISAQAPDDLDPLQPDDDDQGGIGDFLGNLVQHAGDHLCPGVPGVASLLNLSDAEDDDEVVASRPAPRTAASSIIMPSQRLVDHQLPATLSRSRPPSRSSATGSSATAPSASPSSSARGRTSGPSQKEAEAEKRFDNFIQLRVSSSAQVYPSTSGGTAHRLPSSGNGGKDQAAPPSRRHDGDADGQAQAARADDRGAEVQAVPPLPSVDHQAAPAVGPLVGQDQVTAQVAPQVPPPLPAQVATEVATEVAAEVQPPAVQVAAEVQPAAQVAVQVAAQVQPPAVDTWDGGDDDDGNLLPQDANDPDPLPDAPDDPLPGGSGAVAAADAGPDDPLPGGSGLQAGGAAQEAAVPGGSAPLRQRKKRSEEFPVRFSPRKHRDGHKYPDTYYY